MSFTVDLDPPQSVFTSTLANYTAVHDVIVTATATDALSLVGTVLQLRHSYTGVVVEDWMTIGTALSAVAQLRSTTVDGLRVSVTRCSAVGTNNGFAASVSALATCGRFMIGTLAPL